MASLDARVLRKVVSIPLEVGASLRPSIHLSMSVFFIAQSEESFLGQTDR
ncbi:Hypothetical protein FKW44_020623 [Caligus rogercresseyi]|uniref:Uncharacterized protein n=1 Tax=Caligus rogercresseyi TaxID=217165 RepID=A0A7T8JZP6_CALRO|nr:Hypothetical protein FKW44_020623 [Caligus rogercresseyi]